MSALSCGCRLSSTGTLRPLGMTTFAEYHSSSYASSRPYLIECASHKRGADRGHVSWGRQQERLRTRTWSQFCFCAAGKKMQRTREDCKRSQRESEAEDHRARSCSPRDQKCVLFAMSCHVTNDGAREMIVLARTRRRGLRLRFDSLLVQRHHVSPWASFLGELYRALARAIGPRKRDSVYNESSSNA